MFDILFLRYLYMFQSHFSYYKTFFNNFINNNKYYLKKNYKCINIFFYNYYIYKNIKYIDKLNIFFDYYKKKYILNIKDLNLNNYYFLKNNNINSFLKIKNSNNLNKFIDVLKKKKKILIKFLDSNFLLKKQKYKIKYQNNLEKNICFFKLLNIPFFFKKNIFFFKYIYIEIKKNTLNLKNIFKFKIYKFIFMYLFKELFYIFGVQFYFKSINNINLNELLSKIKEINLYILNNLKKNKIIFFKFLIMGIEQILNLENLIINIKEIKIILILFLENFKNVLQKFIYFLFYDFSNFIQYNVFENLESFYKILNVLFNTYNINNYSIMLDYNKYRIKNIINYKIKQNLNINVYFLFYFIVLIQYNYIYNEIYNKKIKVKDRINLIKKDSDIFLIYEHIDFLLNLNFENFKIEDNNILDIIFLDKFYKIINIFKNNIGLIDKLIKKTNIIVFEEKWNISFYDIIFNPNLLVTLQIKNINKIYNTTPLYFFIYTISL